MKTGILTFHREPNDGSLMQCYCVYRLLQKLGVDVEVIDYFPALIRRRRNSWRISRRPPFLFKSAKHAAKIHSHDKFRQAHLRLSPTLLTDDSLHSGIEAIERLNYDAIVVGSDTVWDTRIAAGGPAPPNVYFLPGMRQAKRVSFAASMDKGSERDLTHEARYEVARCLEQFDFISVRDQFTTDFLVKLGIDTARIHFLCDPTLLFDFSDILQSDADFRGSLGGQVAGIAVTDRRLRIELTRQFRQLGFSIVNLLSESVRYQVEMPSGWSVEQRVGFFGELDVLATDRFHSTIFTLVQSPGTPVLAIEPAQFYPGRQSKLRDLMTRMGAKDHVWHFDKELPIPDNLVANFLQTTIDADAIIQSSIEFIRTAGQTTFSRLAEVLLSKRAS